MDCPEPREVHTADRGNVIEVPEVGGLHHHYERVAARRWSLVLVAHDEEHKEHSECGRRQTEEVD